ncbi:uncharacterized protein UV8b_05892 [Ustilaginoidea virens]|uniref:Uncharacterized protein n=1 Tax=Ustilaginoidea virens TaxID=1159556 RepID=A0A8E5HU29_USTVR|nr:uncharacterized protein UV8b_05892 [Ustilaginoidea virens]QUC21649.1 hypothetical protein UV8b_05892 [Ustilaginoidea virens]
MANEPSLRRKLSTSDIRHQTSDIRHQTSDISTSISISISTSVIISISISLLPSHKPSPFLNQALPTPFAKMLSVKNILFLAVAAAGSVIKRDVSQTKSNLKTINSDTQSVTSAVNDYNGGGMFAAMPIINAEQTLDNDIQSATNNANKLGTISTADAKALIDYIGNTIQPSMRTALKALKSKKPQFDADQLTGVVHDTLQSLQSDTDKLADALIKAVPASQKSQAKAPKDKIDADFNDAIAYFSS